MLEGKRVMYYNERGDPAPRGTLELNAKSKLKKIPTKDRAFHVVSEKQVKRAGTGLFFYLIPKCSQNIVSQKHTNVVMGKDVVHMLTCARGYLVLISSLSTKIFASALD